MNPTLSFLKKTLAGQITLEDQQKILRTLTPSAKELAEVVPYLLTKMVQKIDLPGSIDLCGTGGSGLPRINTSTIAAFVVAALGVNVAKHGNKAASGRFGSFDLLEELNIPPLTESKIITKIAHKTGLAFLYAPIFHPVMKEFGAVRKALGRPTFFNLLGPLLNPAHTEKQIIGTPLTNAKIMAKTCAVLGKKHVFIVSGSDGLDEVTVRGKTFVTEVREGKMKKYTITPEDFGIKTASFTEIEGGNAFINTKIAIEILANRYKTRHSDLVLVNAALGLVLAGKAETLKEGYLMARYAIRSGLAQKKYEQYQSAVFATTTLAKIATHKKKEVAQRKKIFPLEKIECMPTPPQRNFTKALQTKGGAVVAEIKKASPSNGRILTKKMQVTKLAQIYESAGANAISVLCDKKYFQGSLTDLQNVKKITQKTPLLCKDFIVDPYQIYEAQKYGADAILLIAAILTTAQIKDFLRIAQTVKIAAICEIHTISDLLKVQKTSAKIIGINNRNLQNFEINLQTTQRLAPFIPKEKIIIAESGIHKREDVRALPQKTNAILVGTSILKSTDPKEKIKELKNAHKPLLKICGIRKLSDALFCEKSEVDFIGLNFVPTSKRKIDLKEAKKICDALHHTKTVGIFQSQSLTEVNAIAQKTGINFIQLSGTESEEFVQQCCKPVIKIKKDLSYEKSSAIYELFDGPQPGSGTQFDHRILKNYTRPFFLAGGITAKNLPKILTQINPFGIDIASGIETNGKIDRAKIIEILQIIHQ